MHNIQDKNLAMNSYTREILTCGLFFFFFLSVQHFALTVVFLPYSECWVLLDMIWYKGKSKHSEMFMTEKKKQGLVLCKPISGF